MGLICIVNRLLSVVLSTLCQLDRFASSYHYVILHRFFLLTVPVEEISVALCSIGAGSVLRNLVQQRYPSSFAGQRANYRGSRLFFCLVQ
jgi:hypothetical protein